MVPYTMLELDPDASWSQEGPAPSNDIWKKFELIPTPPRSPLRDTDFDLTNTKTDFDLGSIPDDLLASFDLPLLEGDELDLALDSVDLDDTSLANFNFGDICSHGVKRNSCQSCNQLAQAGSELKHDCMWVGICTDRSHSFAHQQHVGATRTHRDSCLHMLMDQSSSLVETAGFTHLAELEASNSEDEDSQMEDEVDYIDDSNDHHQSTTVSRPDTPSESSDTDTDCEPEHYQDTLDVCREEEVSTSEHTNIVHVDHSYHCVRIPTPEELPVNQPQPAYTTSTLHTPSDSEDEIDVVSVNSLDSNSSTTTSSTSTSRSRKSYHPSISIADTVKIRASSLPTNPSRKARKEIQQAMSQGVRRRGGHKRRANALSLKAPKRLNGSNGSGRRRGSPRSDSDDPEKRQMHNSLERLRRVDLRNAFEEVRQLVPELQDRDKAPKVEILKKAADFCKFVTKQDQHMAQERERLKRYQQELKRKKAALERHLYN
ncbi:unnamed protein product [Meganyctiphanes norvegica]|uniref:BHLH domain-containing protein n=1 Tax=Meganyctiphanes norvegica TaxID=48144 RepID=A0AAV2Q455_MEGNR